MSKGFTLWFHQVNKGDVPLVGGKGANLGEMTQANIPVPPGFIVSAEAYFYFLEKAGLERKIKGFLDTLDINDSTRLQEVAAQIKQTIMESPMPTEIAEEISRAYREMRKGLVAVRSSATAEDLPEASFAGQQRTFLNVQGEAEVIAAVQGCWASLFEPRAIFYRHQQGFDHFKVGVAVPVQEMVQSEASGVMFTLDPITNDKDKIVVEAVFGLGETIVSGEVTPDLYVVDKKRLEILDKRIERQEWELVRNLEKRRDGDENNIQATIPPTEQSRQKLADKEIIALAQIGRRIEELYQFPQDIEWARKDNHLYIVQARPVTTLELAQESAESVVLSEARVLLSGSPASPGIGAGPVKTINDASEINIVMAGDVLVAEMTTPDFVPAMKRAVAIVTDRGGRTAHAAIVSRELGIPCVVGTKDATRILKSGQMVTVDGSRGKVYEGKILETKVAPNVIRRRHLKTRTRLYVNLAEPELAPVVAARDVDGVGLLRAEFIIAQIGEHPNYMLSQGRGQEFIDKLAEGLTQFATAFYPRPVVYRTADLKSNEYRSLKGGEAYEEVEENPMLGYRGASRYISDLAAYKLELESIKRVRQHYNNLWVMIPFVRTVKQLAETKKLLSAYGLRRSPTFKLWMMVEVPSNIFLLDKFIDVGIDGISIGSNDLTQLILGIDRDNPKLAEDFDERDEAVMMALEMAIKTAARRGITCSICGQAPSVYPELTKKLVEWGITSVSVAPDTLDQTRELIARMERRLAKAQGEGAPSS
ncbi:MAG: phosphoenolpyruvate synthase [Chloroflexi bacterium]|nr:phosphoenolpyruvate synthase [Chloroflexota bacterium]